MSTIIYKNCEQGDWVECCNCGKKMLVPYGSDQCPECTMDGALAWAYGEDYAEMNVDLLKAMGEEMEFSEHELLPQDYMSPQMLQEENPDLYHELLGHTHHCNICGKEMKWDDNIWVNGGFGVCEECHSKMPKDINEKLQEEDYDKTVLEYLHDIGATF